MAKHRISAVKTRRIIQALVFLLFLYLFAITVAPIERHLPTDLFLRSDPLIALTTTLSLRGGAHILLDALPIIILTVLFGRVFCGWLCPMGATLDIAAHFSRRRAPKPPREKAQRFPRLRRLKYYLLGGLLVTSIFVAAQSPEPGLHSTTGLSLAYLFDPIATLTRSLVLGIVAPLQMLLIVLHVDQGLALLATNEFVMQHAQFLGVVESIQSTFAIMTDPGNTPIPLLVYRSAIAAFVIFIAIIAANGLTRRFWCRYICPLGALLGVFSRFAPFKKRVSPDCNDCGLCIRTCRMAAISNDPHLYRAAECVACHECISICPKQAISYRPAAGNIKTEPPLDLSRRRLLQATGIGVASVVLIKSDWGAKKTEIAGIKSSAAGLIRPPGAMAEDEFVTACVRCSACMKVCPTNGLQPAVGEGGLEALWTPVLVPRIGQCTQACNSCSMVCPTGAIQPFKLEEKYWLYMGAAVIDRSSCIAWGQDKVCSVCAEACSYTAIHQQNPRSRDGKRPVVDEKKCVGCGMCEKSCPIQPYAAIRVYAFGDKRHLSRKEQHEIYLNTQNRSIG
jgi:MauM/NapG family ferredoxin protein